MKERIIELLNSNNVNDVVLGILLSVEENLWEEIATFRETTEENAKYVDYTYNSLFIGNRFHRIIYKNEIYCIQDNRIHRYRKPILNFPYNIFVYIIYNDNSLKIQ